MNSIGPNTIKARRFESTVQNIKKDISESTIKNTTFDNVSTRSARFVVGKSFPLENRLGDQINPADIKKSDDKFSSVY